MLLQQEAARYLRAKEVLPDLREAYKDKLIDLDQYKSMRQQALAGNVDAVARVLVDITTYRWR